jgi:hypothetical protein
LKERFDILLKVIHNIDLPDSEARRQYLIRIIDHLRRTKGLSAADARKAAIGMMNFLQMEVAMGHPVHLGFLRIFPKRKAPTTIRGNLKTQDGSVYCLGERYIWKIGLSRKWLSVIKPKWWPAR